MTPAEQARIMFANMPDAAFNNFIIDLLGNDPWPFSQITDSTVGTKWYYHFGGLSLYQFKNLHWKLSNLILNENILHPDSQGDIYRLILDHVLNHETYIRKNVTNSKERFLWHMAFIKRTGSVCAPITMIRVGNLFRILDGSHRMAALYALRLQTTISVPVWIGS